jgi:hypothetical protein
MRPIEKMVRVCAVVLFWIIGILSYAGIFALMYWWHCVAGGVGDFAIFLIIAGVWDIFIKALGGIMARGLNLIFQ